MGRVREEDSCCPAKTNVDDIILGGMLLKRDSVFNTGCQTHDCIVLHNILSSVT